MALTVSMVAVPTVQESKMVFRFVDASRTLAREGGLKVCMLACNQASAKGVSIPGFHDVVACFLSSAFKSSKRDWDGLTSA